ncbi:MAG: hypothetical protein EB084_10210 [Proteobacteria bacterium]|nr:hypothetical protein [Pseudomonadota bacterium]
MTKHLQSIQERLGFVPMFAQTMETLTDAVEPNVDLVTRFSLGATGIEPKTRALVGIAAATASGYPEMVSFHAGFHPELEEPLINEAEFLGAHTAGLATFLAARVPSFETFKQDVDKIAAAVKKLGQQAPAIPPEGNTQDQIRAVFGFVPAFMQELSKLPTALEALWKITRLYYFQKTHVDAQTRALICLGAAAAIRCPHSIYLHTCLAQARGVSETQLQEVAFLAHSTVQWGTYLRSRGFGPAMLRSDARLLRDRIGALRT